jgi:photosystem II stability/assembly factor-like uncharacterized protein
MKFRHPHSILFLIALVCVAHPCLFAQRSMVQEMVNAVSPDNLMNTVKALQAFGTRYEYSPQQEKAADYLVAEFTRLGLNVQSDWYNAGTYTFADGVCAGRDTVFLAGGNILASFDRGFSWTSQKAGSFYGLAFVNSHTGWAVGASGAISKTTNSGTTWVSQSSGVAKTLYCVAFANESLGLVVGASGTIVRTSDGGSTWASVSSGTQSTLQSIKVVDMHSVWICGYDGVILHSTDGGLTWSAQTSGTTSSIYSIDFIDSRTGWAVGFGPVVLKTTDGGVTWPSAEIPAGLWASNKPVAVCFGDTLHGWIAESFGGLLKTTDGGRSWTSSDVRQSYYARPFFKKMTLTDKSNLAFVGLNCTVFISTDAGSTWAYRGDNFPASYYHRTRNVVASLPGSKTPEQECIIVAHYDAVSDNPSVSAPGADNNASGISAVMEAARICRDYRFESTIKFVCMSMEEEGTFGSAHYASEATSQARDIVGVINGDMIGYPVTGDTTRLVAVSPAIHNRLADSVIVYNDRYHIAAQISSCEDPDGQSDHGPFAVAGYDAISMMEATPDEINTLDPYIFTTSDTWDKLHPGLLRRGAQVELAAVTELARPVAKVTEVSSASQIPRSFSLRQNYPNPFNPATTIAFALPSESHVRLEVYGLLGNLVSVLVEDRLAAGYHSVQFNASSLPSGVYFYRITAGAYSDTKSLLLIK